MESFWKKHANDSDWDSRYIDIDRSSALTDFTQTIVGSGTATYGSTGLVLVNSAGAGDSIQYQYGISQIQARAPHAPSADGLHPGIYSYEMEFIIQGIVASPQSVQGFAGFVAQDTTILAGHTDSIGLTTPASVGTVGLDLFTGGNNNLVNYPTGGPNPNAFAYLPTDGLSHELTFQVVPMAGDGKSGEFRVWLDGDLVVIFGLADQLYWVGLTQALLAPSFAYGNSNASLTAAQRTVTIQKIGWAVRR